MRSADRHRDRNGETTLPGASESAVADDLGRHWHIRVGKYDDMVLRTALTLAAFPLFTGARVDVARDWRRSDEADGSDFRMVDECVDYSLAAVDEADHAFGQPGLFEEFVDVSHRERDALTGLENEGISS